MQRAIKQLVVNTVSRSKSSMLLIGTFKGSVTIEDVRKKYARIDHYISTVWVDRKQKKFGLEVQGPLWN